MNITKLLGYEDDMQVVATLTNGQELIFFLNSTRPNVIVPLDIDLVGVDSVSSPIKHIKTQFPFTGVIFTLVRNRDPETNRLSEASADDLITLPFPQ